MLGSDETRPLKRTLRILGEGLCSSIGKVLAMLASALIAPVLAVNTRGLLGFACVLVGLACWLAALLSPRITRDAARATWMGGALWCVGFAAGATAIVLLGD